MNASLGFVKESAVQITYNLILACSCRMSHMQASAILYARYLQVGYA